MGGLARFKTLCNHYQHDDQFKGQSELLTFFSGDAFNPSLESSITKGTSEGTYNIDIYCEFSNKALGKHMVPALNTLDTTIACLGNHDLDFGVEQFQYLASQCQFPWLCANVLDPALGENIPLGNCKRTHVLTSSNGIKIGVIGLVEREWLDTINTLPPHLKYLSASATAAKLAPKLREEGADVVIVVSHQREPNDNKLAETLEPGTVDIVLGGHDHYYNHAVINGTHVLRSGSDFKQLSYIEARRKTDSGKGWDFNITRREVVSSIPEDEETIQVVSKITDALKPKLEKPIGYTHAPLDARFTTVRLKESNLGNFVCDLMRFHYHADCTIMAAGTIRGDQIYPPGVIKVKDMMNCFPFEDPCVVVAIQGKYLLEALENSVSKYPALEGRFPQISGIVFTLDPSKSSGSQCKNVLVGGQPLDLGKEYNVVTRDYMVRGKDGFTSLMLEEEGGPARSIVSEENGVLISMLLRQYFMSLKVLGRWKKWSSEMGRVWGGIQDSLHGVHPVKEPSSPVQERAGNIPASKPVPNGFGKRPLSFAPSHQEPKHRKQDPYQISESDSEDDGADMAPVANDPPARERELIIMRKVMRKWWRIAGLNGRPNMCAEQGEEFGVPWTRGIAPRLEGRIKIINGDP